MTTKDQIKKLELQLDYIVGYRPTGHPWKAEYCLRRSVIERMKDNPKVQEIQKKLEVLYKKLPHKQGYLRYTQEQYINKTNDDNKIQIKEYVNGVRVTRFITPDWR